MYEYRCKDCGKIIERIVYLVSEDDDECTNDPCACGGEFVKILSSPYFRINGYSFKNGYAVKSSKRE